MRRLTFQQLMNLQARYLILIARAYRLNLEDAAIQYGGYMREKINNKHKAEAKSEK